MVSKTIKATVGQKIAYKIIKDGFKTVNGTIDVTSDMDTNVSLETPSTPYTSNIDYSIIENDAFPSIFKLNEDVVLPDDSILEKNDYLLYPKGEYFIADGSNEMVYENNYTINGSVKNFGYTFSNFSSSNYIVLNDLFNPGSNGWETVIKINTTNLSSGGNCWLMGSNTSSNLSWLIGLLTASSPYSRVYLSSNGSSWDIASGVDGSHQYALYTDYWLKFEFTGSQYILSYSTDGQNFIQDIVINSSTPISNNQPIQIGNNEQHNAYFPGTVDLSETYIKIDGEIWWKPQVANVLYNYTINGTCALVRDGVAKGFNTENYLRLETMPSEITSADLIFKGMTPDLNSHNALIAHINSEQYYGIRYNNNKSFSIYNGGWIDGVNTLSVNTWYWFRVKFDGTNWVGYTLEDKDYTSETLPEISQWRQEWTTPNGFLAGNIFNIGFNPITAGEYWKGSVDLEQSFIKINDEVFWNGTNHQQIGYWDANGVIKGFSLANHIVLPSPFKPASKPWEMVFKVKTGENVTTYGSLTGANGNTFKHVFISISNSQINVDLGSNGTSWNIGSISGGNILPNTDYSIKVEYTGNAYNLYYKTLDSEYELIGTIESSTPIYQNELTQTIGINKWNSSNGDCPFLGYVDLNESYINIDGKNWWQGISNNEFKKGNFNMIGNPIINMNGVVSNFSTNNYVKSNHTVNNTTEIFITFTTSNTHSYIETIYTAINSSNTSAGDLYILTDGNLATWNNSQNIDVRILPLEMNTTYQVKTIFNSDGRTFIVYNEFGEILSEVMVNDSNQTFSSTTVVNFGYLHSSISDRYLRGTIDLSKTYITIDDVKYNLLENDGRYLQGIFDESFVDNCNQEQVVKLYHTMSKNNGLTITNDKVNDGNVLYSQYIDNVTIPPRTAQFTYNIDNESWEIV